MVGPEGVVGARKVDHVKGEQLLAEVVRLAEGDVEPDALEGHGLLPQGDPIEQCSSSI
jgi:hypothetical protein